MKLKVVAILTVVLYLLVLPGGALGTDTTQAKATNKSLRSNINLDRKKIKFYRKQLGKVALRLQNEVKRLKLQQIAVLGMLTPDWACIHSYEGAWSDGGSPYYGGLQMDSGFMEEYGPEFLQRWGTANNWPIYAQVMAANRAKNGWWNPYTHTHYSARGYTPWPNTAAMCGLL